MARQSLKTLTEPMYYIKELTDGRVKVGAGILHTLLSRFEKENIIEALTPIDGKKPYQLTETGITLLKKEHQRLTQQVQDGLKELGGI